MNEILEQARNPVVLCSFGKDSMLLLAMAREVRPDIPVIHFGPLSEYAKGIVKDWSLTVLSYAPAEVSIIPNGDEFTLVSDYSFGGYTLPILTDIEPGETCCVDFEKRRLSDWAYDFDVTLIAWKECDTHPTLDQLPHIIDGMPFGNTKLYAPLRDLTDSDVFQALFERGIVVPPENGSVDLCVRCLRNEATFCPMVGAEIPPHTWSPADSLAAFQARFR